MDRPPHPFRFRDFRSYFAARLATTLAQNAMVVVIGWQVYDIARRTMGTRDAALQLGLIGVVQFVPLLLLTLVVGWTADRIDRRWIARTAVLLEAGCAATLAWTTYAGTETLTTLFVVAALLGVSRAFASPALQALAPNLVPPAVLPSAIAMSSIAWQVGAIFGPASGGFLYAIDPATPYFVASTLFAIAFVALLLIRPVAVTTLDRKGNPWAQMVEGLSYVRRNRLVLGALSLDLFAVLLGGATAMLPIYARDLLAVGPQGLGLLRLSPAIGAVLVAAWFSFNPLRRDVGPKLLVAVAIFGGATVGFGLSPFLPGGLGIALGCLALLGAADMVSVYVRQSLIQLHTPDAMRGRVGAVSTLFISGSNELGEAESGFLAAAIGPVAAVVGGGIGAILIAVLWSRWFPELVAARSFDPPQTLEDAPGQEKAT
ncbi:MFS transporter [Sphingomonas sp. 1P06PA]|uniref:MFS transporter n=1 Tax=Sphingomonas sp. 1P06PA TaxID=554121 RepID=UPI0039A58EBA